MGCAQRGGTTARGAVAGQRRGAAGQQHARAAVFGDVGVEDLRHVGGDRFDPAVGLAVGLRVLGLAVGTAVGLVFLSRRVTATMTAKIGNNERQVSDNEASCLSTQHIYITSRDFDDNNGKQTFDNSLGGSSPLAILI